MSNEKQHHSTYIVDLDRCLVDSSYLQEMLEQAYAEIVGEGAETLREIGRLVSESGGSFDMVTALSEMVTTEDLARIRKKFLELTAFNDAMYEPGAREFLQYLRETSKPFFIMTYGGDEWQTWKLMATNLANVPYIILNSKDKGVYITQHYDPFASEYVFDGITNHEGKWRTISLALIDDKAVSFVGLLSPRSRGYWYKPPERHLLQSQIIGQDQLPPDVSIVYSFSDVMQKIDKYGDKS